MSPRAQVYLLGFLLIFLGVGLISYKSSVLSLPVLPGKYETIWTVEAKVRFTAKAAPVKVSLALPKHQYNMEVIQEIFSSSGFGFSTDAATDNNRAIWSKRLANGRQTLYYKLDVYKKKANSGLANYPVPKTIAFPPWQGERYEALRNASARLISDSWKYSSDNDSFTVQVLRSLKDPLNNEARIIRNGLPEKNLDEIAILVFSLAEVPAHIIRGIYLEEDRNRMKAQTLIEVYNGKKWVIYASETLKPGLPENFLIWQRGGKSLLDVEGGKDSMVQFSVLANDVPARNVALAKMGSEQSTLVDYSIYSLPIEQQSIYKFILLVPVGALIVIFMRVVIGIRTAGTFMPVLLAIAFIQTNLWYGVAIFLLILGVGLFVRSYLSRLDLLLVARIAAVVVIVVSMMAFISIISYKLGIEQALTVTFFPMIIIAWTIEHMSILWEDDGPLEVLIQTAGSLLVAILCYLMMTNTYIEHWMFNFPEFLAVLLGLIIIIGHYTGYRLSELFRFRHLRVD